MRKAQSGTSFPQKVKSVVVPAILDGDSADVVLAADADYIGVDGILAMLTDAPEANLSVGAAWVSNAATGVITIRLVALTGNVAGGAQDFLFTAFEAD
jgi:hypothetical protein